MSQYGHIQGNYYLPKVKLNTLRITYLFAVFMGVEHITLWCLSLTLTLTDTYSTLSTNNVDGNCLNLFDNTLVEKIEGFVLTNPINIANHCSLSTSLFTPVTYPDFVTSYPITVSNFCTIISTLTFATDPASISPPAYTPGLYQEVCTGFCSQPSPSPHPESQTLTTYSPSGICNYNLNTIPPEVPIYPVNSIDISNFCNMTTSLLTSVTYDSNYTINSPITISNSCILNALPI